MMNIFQDWSDNNKFSSLLLEDEDNDVVDDEVDENAWRASYWWTYSKDYACNMNPSVWGKCGGGAIRSGYKV